MSSSNKTNLHDRLLPLIAIERGLRAVLLFAIGAVLLTHPHTDWGAQITTLARDTGFDPRSNGIHKLVDKVSSISPRKYTFFGIVALAYAVLEGAEAYGLWRRRRWGEYLTVVATSLLFLPEIYEIVHKLSPLKIAALLVNVAVVIYLIRQLREPEV
ncbi:MAG: hypothetical protein NVSMB51_10490 [Solirubrobacteraceae bacterium]